MTYKEKIPFLRILIVQKRELRQQEADRRAEQLRVLLKGTKIVIKTEPTE